MNKTLHFLLLEDVPTDAQIIEHALRKGNFLFVLKRVTTEKAFREALEEFKPDIILADYKLPAFDGISALRIVEKNCPDIPFIFVSGYRGEELAVESLKSGAKDYILKENLLRLVPSVRLALSEREEHIKRRQAEEALRKSKASLDNAQRIAHIGSWEWDVVKNKVYWSDEAFRIFGFVPQEFDVTYDVFLNCVHPDDREFVKKSVHDALYEKRPYEIDHRILLKDGRINFVHSRAMVTFDDTGKAIRMAGIVQDITERKRAEEELNTEKIKFLSVINAMEDGLTIQDLDYNIIYQNEAVKNVFGVRLGEKCYSAYEGKNSICDGCPVEMVYKDGKPHISERRIVLPSGEIAFFENIASPIKNASGKIVSCLEIVRNITGRKQAEAEMHLLQTIVMEISKTKNLRDTLVITIEKICNFTGWIYGEAWVINRDKNLLERNHAIYSSGNGLERFSAFSAGFTFPMGVGLPGRTWASKQPVWVRDVTQDPDYRRSEVAKDAGLKAGVAFPIIADDEVVTVIVFYKSKAAEKNEQLVNLVSTVMQQLGSLVKRKQAEDALRQTEELLQSILDNTTAVVYVKDTQGKYIFINKRYGKLFKIKKDEVEGKTDYDLWPKEVADLFQANDREVIETKAPLEFEERVYRNDILRTYLSIKVPLFDRTGTVYAVCSISTDITERKRMEEQLRKLSCAVEQSPSMVIITDTKGNIQYVNPRFTQLTGYTPEEVIGKNPRILKSDKTSPDEYKELWDAITSGREWSGEIMNKKKCGEFYWELMSISPIKDARGVITNFLKVAEDITEIKQADEEKEKLREQLYHAQKMEAVGQLAGGIAHDFNNILTAIVGYGELLQMEMKTDGPSGVYVQKILTSAGKATKLTQGLLTFSRKNITDQKPVKLHKLIKDIENLLIRLIRENIELRVMLSDKDITIMADSSQLEQVFMNLATNASDAMPAGGIITLSTDVLELDKEFIKTHGYGKPGMYALISFSDTGTGMDEAIRKRVFEPFFTTKEVGKGTGLGLSIVYGIIKQHKGYINVYSEPGKGTTFRIYLPLTESKNEETKSEMPASISGGTETILIAEDETEVRELTKTLLNGFGYKVIDAVDGEDAIRKFVENKETINLIVLDAIMPKKNGREVYEVIRNLQPEIKTIFVSGYGGDIIQGKDLFEKGIIFIPKPISPTKFLKKVREVLDK